MNQPQSSAGLKAVLRRDALARRDDLDPVWRREASVAIAERAAPLVLSLRPNVVAAYWPIRSEADPRGLMARLGEAGVAVVLPAVAGRAGLRFRASAGGSNLSRAVFGTFEPPPQAPEMDPDIVLLPLAGFDRNGHRLGYGKGYYDIAIARLVAEGRRPLLVGVAFSPQEVPAIPAEPHDRRLDYIVTEREVLRFPSSPAN